MIKKFMNLFKKMLGYKVVTVEELPVPAEHRIEMPKAACEMQDNLDAVEIAMESICPVCKESPCICHDEVKDEMPCAYDEACTEPVKKKHRGRPRKKKIVKE